MDKFTNFHLYLIFFLIGLGYAFISLAMGHLLGGGAGGGVDVAALDMAGGGELESPAGRVFSTNLTPDPTGIAHYDAATFVQVMRTGKLGTLHPMMPWAVYSRMNDEDLGALYAYMKTLKPVRHVVTHSAEPTECAVCGLKHGGGDRNRT